MYRTQGAALVIALSGLLAGCLDSPNSTVGAPTIAPPASESVSNFSWNVSQPGLAYAVVALEAVSDSKYEVSVKVDATWKEAQARFDFFLLAGSYVKDGFVGEGAAEGSANTCGAGTGFQSASDCPKQTLESRGGSGFGGTLKPGRYLLLAAAPGAANVSFAFEGTFADPVTVLWKHAGAASLLPLEPQGAVYTLARRDVRYTEQASITLGTPSLAVFRTTVGAFDAPTYRAAGPDGKTFECEPMTFFCRDPEGNERITANVALTPGDWTFSTEGGIRGPQRGSQTLVAILHEAPFVDEAGAIVIPDGLTPTRE